MLAEKPLVERCLKGDPEAWGEFARRFGPAVRGAVRRVLGRFGSAADAEQEEDLVQEAFAYLARPGEGGPLARFRWECPLEYYVVTVATQSCVYQLRKRQEGWERRLKALPEELLATLEAPPRPTAAGLAANGETRGKLDKALAALPDRERLALQLFYWDGLPADRIGRILGVSHAATRQILSRSRDRLRELLKSLRSICLL